MLFSMDLLSEFSVFSLTILNFLFLGLASNNVSKATVNDILSVVGVWGQRIRLILEFNVFLFMNIKYYFSINNKFTRPNTLNFGKLLENIFFTSWWFWFLKLEIFNELWSNFLNSSWEEICWSLLFADWKETLFVWIISNL